MVRRASSAAVAEWSCALDGLFLGSSAAESRCLPTWQARSLTPSPPAGRASPGEGGMRAGRVGAAWPVLRPSACHCCPRWCQGHSGAQRLLPQAVSTAASACRDGCLGRRWPPDPWPPAGVACLVRSCSFRRGGSQCGGGPAGGSRGPRRRACCPGHPAGGLKRRSLGGGRCWACFREWVPRGLQGTPGAVWPCQPAHLFSGGPMFHFCPFGAHAGGPPGLSSVHFANWPQ